MDQHEGSDDTGADDQPPVLTPYTVEGSAVAAAGAADVAASARPRGRTLGVVLSVFALLAASGFVVANLNAADGTDTPEAAVEKLFQALEDRDVVGLLEVLPPSERSVLKDPVLDIVEELQRLEVLSDFDLGGVPGLEIDVQGLELASTTLGAGVASVSIEGGTISGRVDPDALPFGDLVRDQMGDDLAEASEDDESNVMEPEDLSEGDVQIVTVQEADGWHVSLWYTVAESARGDDEPVPDFGSGLTPIGADSPEGAVRGLLDRAIDLDLAGVIGMLPPDEMRVLYDYGPLFIDEAEDVEDGSSIELSNLEVHAEGSGSVRRVVLDAVDVRFADDYSDMSMSYRDGCMNMTMRYEDEWDSFDGESLEDDIEYCVGEEPTVNGESMFDVDREDSSMLYIPDPSGLIPDDGEALLALTVVEVDGKWYVSPTRSLFDPILAVLRGLDADALREFIEGMEDWFTSSSEEFADVGGEFSGPESECYEAWDALPGDASDEEWDAVQDEVDACLEDAGIDTSFPGDECYEITDALSMDATDEEWEAANAEVDACLAEAQGDMPDDLDEDGMFGDVYMDCLSVHAPVPDATTDEDPLADQWSAESLAFLQEVFDCVEGEDPAHAVLPCLQDALDLANATPEEQDAAESELATCMDEAMPGAFDYDPSDGDNGSFEPYPTPTTQQPTETTMYPTVSLVPSSTTAP